jgi:hypothetical protein
MCYRGRIVRGSKAPTGSRVVPYGGERVEGVNYLLDM